MINLESITAGLALTGLDPMVTKYGFGQFIDFARSAPVAVSKHCRPIVVVVAVKEFERLNALDTPAKVPTANRKA